MVKFDVNEYQVSISSTTLFIYICNRCSVANYDRKHMENSKTGLENSWNFFHPKEWEPCQNLGAEQISVSLPAVLDLL